MRSYAIAAVVLGLVGSTAAAGPVTAGISLGLAQSKADAGPDTDANHTLGLYGRLTITSRLAAQLELSRISTDDSSNTDIRSATGLLVIDLGSRSQLVPILLAGAGLDRASRTYGSTDAVHAEAGLGLELRTGSGFTLGADARIGTRSVEVTSEALPVRGGALAAYTPSSLRDGEYRSARVTVGVRF